MPDSAADLVSARPFAGNAARGRGGLPPVSALGGRDANDLQSAILRQRDEQKRHEEMEAFVSDLKLVASALEAEG